MSGPGPERPSHAHAPPPREELIQRGDGGGLAPQRGRPAARKRRDQFTQEEHQGQGDTPQPPDGGGARKPRKRSRNHRTTERKPVFAPSEPPLPPPAQSRSLDSLLRSTPVFAPSQSCVACYIRQLPCEDESKRPCKTCVEGNLACVSRAPPVFQDAYSRFGPPAVSAASAAPLPPGPPQPLFAPEASFSGQRQQSAHPLFAPSASFSGQVQQQYGASLHFNQASHMASRETVDQLHKLQLEYQRLDAMCKAASEENRDVFERLALAREMRIALRGDVAPDFAPTVPPRPAAPVELLGESLSDPEIPHDRRPDARVLHGYEESRRSTRREVDGSCSAPEGVSLPEVSVAADQAQEEHGDFPALEAVLPELEDLQWSEFRW
jgi:hypothetical protein